MDDDQQNSTQASGQTQSDDTPHQAGNSAFQKVIKEHQDTDISESTQQELNKPLGTQISDDKKDYIKEILKLLDSKEIDPFVPETILNKKIYDALSEENKGKVDTTLRNLADMLRMVKELYEKEGADNFQVESMIESIKLTKDRIESQSDIGDVYKV